MIYVGSRLLEKLSKCPRDKDLIRLCGHATLASACIMKSHPELLEREIEGRVVYNTLSGKLIVDVSGEDGLLRMDFPADDTYDIHSTISYPALAAAIGVTEDDILHIKKSKGCQYGVIEVAQPIDIASISVDSKILVSLLGFN